MTGCWSGVTGRGQGPCDERSSTLYRHGPLQCLTYLLLCVSVVWCSTESPVIAVLGARVVG